MLIHTIIISLATVATAPNMHIYIYIYIYIHIYNVHTLYIQYTLTLGLIGRDGCLRTLMSQFRVCLSAEGGKNVSWPWLSPFRGCVSLTMAFTGKFVIYIHITYIYICIYMYIYIYNIELGLYIQNQLPTLNNINLNLTYYYIAIFNSLIKGQFYYCLLLWIFNARAVNHKVNRLHEKGLRALLNDETSTCYQKVTILLFM